MKGMCLARQDARHDLADAAEAGDDHVPVVLGQRVEGARHDRPSAPAVSSISSSSGVAAIDSVTATDSSSATGCSSTPAADAGREQHEGELAALGDGERQASRGTRLQPGAAAEHVQDRRS